jgi:hypothetical protein
MREILAPDFSIDVRGFDPAHPFERSRSFIDIAEDNDTALGLSGQDRFTEELQINVSGLVEVDLLQPEDDEIFFSQDSQFADLSIPVFSNVAPINSFPETDRKFFDIGLSRETRIADDRAINPYDAFDIVVGGVNGVVPELPTHFVEVFQPNLESESRFADVLTYNTAPEEIFIDIFGQSASVFTKVGYLGSNPLTATASLDLLIGQNSLNSGLNTFGSYVYSSPFINENGEAQPRQRQVWTI